MSNLTIGLFGSCGKSTWRDTAILTYEDLGIPYFNPQVPDGEWLPGMVVDENKHLQEDSIILFPVLAETPATGSLGEIGFSVLNVMHNILSGSEQHLVVLIDDECTIENNDNLRNASNNTRTLVKSKLEGIRHPNIHMVSTMEDMIEISVRLHQIVVLKEELTLRFGANV